ncbi:MAG TPA: hypothetical protein VLJ76_09935 [Gaiellaceae bacterium]|nr:hypothetical protein [Gaiellaceae bacterium]
MIERSRAQADYLRMFDRLLDRLRQYKRNLGWLGAILTVGIAAGAITYTLYFSARKDPNQDAIRAYYESTIGGSVPRAAVVKLHVEGCVPTGGVSEVSVDGVYICTIDVDGVHATPCFDFQEDRVDGGPYQFDQYDEAGCSQLIYNPIKRAFFVAKQV